MHMAAVCLFSLLAMCQPYPLLTGLVLLLCLPLLTLARSGWRPYYFLLALLLLAFPAYHQFIASQQLPVAPDRPLVTSLQPYSTYAQTLPPAMTEDLYKILESREQIGHPLAQDLFSSLDLPSYVSISLLNLDLDPVRWSGRFFSGDYLALQPLQPELRFTDGRLFYSSLQPLPDEATARGFLVIEVMLLSEHRAERAASWLDVLQPAYRDYKPVVVEPQDSEVLYQLALDLGVTPPTYDIHLIPEPKQAPKEDLLAMGWTLCWLICLLLGSRGMDRKKQALFALGCLVVISIPYVESRDHLSVFASFVFGTSKGLGLLLSPFRFLITVVCMILLCQSLVLAFGRERKAVSVLVFLLVVAAAWTAPGFLQDACVFSLVHPLEAFDSPGAALGFLAFLFCFAGFPLLLDATAPLATRDKLMVVAFVSPLLYFFSPFALVSVALLWLFQHPPTPVKAALAVLCFYPSLVMEEQEDEVDFVKYQLLDEITLLGERNYFRMGRVIDQLPVLERALEQGGHPHMMELFAKQSGLLDNAVDFSLALVGPDNLKISEFNHHLTTSRLRELSFARDRIDIFKDEEDGSRLMAYRNTLYTEFGHFDFIAILGNDYQNVSLVRGPRNLTDSLRGRENMPMPYFAYIFEVFDRSGKLRHSQGSSKSKPLLRQDLNRLEEEPVFWRVEGRNTVFFFRDRDTLYRVTHKATPIKMIFARYISLWLGLSMLMTAVRLAQRPGRGLLARWRRSFAMKLASFMFLASVLPTTTLGYFLISSIQKNQAREELNFAQARMLAAVNLISGLSEQEGPGGPRSTRQLPLQIFSRILGEDLSLFVDGQLLNTNQPEMYRMGMMDRRLSFDLVHQLSVENTPFVLTPAEKDNRAPAVAYASVPLGSGPGVVAMTIIPFSQRQQMRWREQLEFSLSVLFGLLFVMALVTRSLAMSFLHPVSAITRSAARMAKGLINRPISIGRQDELERMVAAFNTMQDRVQASQDQLRQQLRLLDETRNSMSSGLLGFDQRGRLILENAIAWKLLQFEQPVDNMDALVAHEERLAPLVELFHADRNGEFAFQLEREGEERQIIGKVRMVKAIDEMSVRCIVAFEDITDALDANRFKAWSEMARRVAHEIKNPLTPIQLELDYLNKLYHDQHPTFGEALAEATQEIRAQVEHLKRTATEFSDYARPLQLNRSETNLSDLLHEITEPYHKTLDALVLERMIEGDVYLSVDVRLLRRAFHNLVVNAVQAMEQEGTLTIRLFREQGEIVIWIQDTGPGIPLDEQARVFEAYFSTKDQGSGLGLVIARKYLTSHDGELMIDADYTGGTRFVARLPDDPHEEREP